MFLLFFLAWIIFNGRVTVEIVIFGIVIAAAVFAFICKFMDYSLQKEKKFYRKVVFLIKYAFVLVKEIIVANIAVARMILTEREVMEPVIVKFQTDLKSELSRVILANSITLTPGTITVSLENGEYTVHCLDKTLAEGMEESVFVKMLAEEEQRG